MNLKFVNYLKLGILLDLDNLKIWIVMHFSTTFGDYFEICLIDLIIFIIAINYNNIID